MGRRLKYSGKAPTPQTAVRRLVKAGERRGIPSRCDGAGGRGCPRRQCWPPPPIPPVLAHVVVACPAPHPGGAPRPRIPYAAHYPPPRPRTVRPPPPPFVRGAVSPEPGGRIPPPSPARIPQMIGRRWRRGKDQWACRHRRRQGPGHQLQRRFTLCREGGGAGRLGRGWVPPPPPPVCVGGEVAERASATRRARVSHSRTGVGGRHHRLDEVLMGGGEGRWEILLTGRDPSMAP